MVIMLSCDDLLMLMGLVYQSLFNLLAVEFGRSCDVFLDKFVNEIELPHCDPKVLKLGKLLYFIKLCAVIENEGVWFLLIK